MNISRSAFPGTVDWYFIQYAAHISALRWLLLMVPGQYWCPVSQASFGTCIRAVKRGFIAIVLVLAARGSLGVKNWGWAIPPIVSVRLAKVSILSAPCWLRASKNKPHPFPFRCRKRRLYLAVSAFCVILFGAAPILRSLYHSWCSLCVWACFGR